MIHTYQISMLLMLVGIFTNPIKILLNEFPTVVGDAQDNSFYPNHDICIVRILVKFMDCYQKCKVTFKANQFVFV